MAGEIKYKYALDRNDSLVKVEDLIRENLPRGTVFYSLDFHQELVPRLGKVRRKHFAHKKPDEALGGRETYLHALGKRIFRDNYERCLQSNTPFYLEYLKHGTCTKLQSEFGLECKLTEGPFKYNLIKYFTEIREERKDGEFRPDLLLYYPARDAKIYIEITVTHQSTEKKLQSGNRIVEYKISNEEDIDLIKSSLEGINTGNATLHNFSLNESRGTLCESGCSIHSFYYFYVARNGKCKLWDSQKEVTLRQLINGIKSDTLWEATRPHHRFAQIVTGRRLSHIDVYHYFMAKAAKEKVAVKNCFLCKYHRDHNSRYFRPAIGFPIYCRKFKKSCKSNDASGCAEYSVSLDYVDHYLNKGRRQETRLP